MSFDLSIFTNNYIPQKTITKILACNETSKQYGVILTKQDAAEIALSKNESLKKNGRVEFTDGIIDKIIFSFCDSPYISQDNYKNTIETLLEIFYEYKNETLDLISDDELIEYMVKSFNNSCNGSLELLSGRELCNLTSKVKNCDLGDDINE